MKMQALGNDFVVIDLRDNLLELSSFTKSKIVNRRLGIGADQLITLYNPKSKEADIFVEVTNADGSISGTWGNGVRCIAKLMSVEKNKNKIIIETPTRTHNAHVENDEISIILNNPGFECHEIPLTQEVDTLYAPIELGPLKYPTLVGLYSLHMVFFVTKIDHIPLDYLGAQLEYNNLLKSRSNVIVAEPYGPNQLRVRIWEKGSGITPSCGSGAAAAALAAIRRDVFKEGADIQCLLDGGILQVNYKAPTVWLKGEAQSVFSGVADLSIWE